MNRQLSVSIPEYWQYENKPQNFDDLVARINRPAGLWCVQELDKLTGRTLKEQWLENSLTNVAADYVWKSLIAPSAPTQITPGNRLAIANTLGFLTLSSGISSGSPITSFSYNNKIGPTIPSGTKLLIGAGTGNTLLVTLTAAISAASGTASIASITPGSAISAGANIRYDYESVPTDDSTTTGIATPGPVSYTAALPLAQFVYTSRQVSISNNDAAHFFSTTGTPAATAGDYTAAWIVSANPVTLPAHGVVHVPLDTKLTINASTAAFITIVEKI